MNRISNLLVAILSLVPVISAATQYTIVKLVPDVKLQIGHKVCGVGDSFDDRDTIFWNNADTLVMNVICNDANCKVVKQTIFYPHDLLQNDSYQSLSKFLFAQIVPLVGYSSCLDTIHVYQYGATYLQLLRKDYENLYVHVANSNYTFEMQPTGDQYFIHYDDFVDPYGTLNLELYSHPSCKSQYWVRNVIVKFE